ncbi:ABC transporter permease [Cryptosporangium arvum]|uniref:ABC-type multidrug transport system, permease component n=1 Tax=Cryptosporangium arvum DSM 44712 TaxID=927661 RepID=A0A011AKI2_9ACTN|nr:ABC transporter permease [Cryptosporangium arvum]EXG82481.1 ABC-type multidrug transport system, permease component [Cryptosporangium arvum DSM 44712]
MRPVLLIVGKDLRERLRDRSLFLFAFVVPLLLAFVYDLVLGKASDPDPFRYAVVDLDGGPVAAAFADDVLGALVDDDVVTVRRVATTDAARTLARDGDIDAAFVLPAGFSARVPTRDPAGIDVIGNVDAPTGTQVATAIADAYAGQLNAVRVTVAAGGDPRVAEQAAPLTVVGGPASRKVLDQTTYMAAAMAILFLFFTVQAGLSSVIDERSAGTLRRILALPVPRWTVLAAKAVTSIVIGVVGMGVLVVASSLLMGADWGDPVGVALLVVGGVLAATGVTAAVVATARTAEQAGSRQAVVAILFGLLGGVFFPVGQLGGAVTTLSLVTPHAWFLRGLGELAGGGGATAALPSAGVLTVFGVVTGAIALVGLRREVAP